MFGARPVLSFTPLLPAGGWNRESLSREQRTQSRRLQYFLQEKKKKKSLLQPLLQAKFRFPLLAISNSKAIFAAKLLPLELNLGNSDAGGGLFLILPSIYPITRAAFFFFLPSCKVSHTAKQNTEDHGREERTKGGRKRETKIQAEGQPLLVKMEKVCPGCFQNLLTYESQMNPRPGSGTNLILLGGHRGC